MAQQTIRVTSRAGLDLTAQGVAADVGGSDKWANSGSQIIWIKNASGGSYTATFAYPATVDGQTVPSKTVTIATGHEAIIGPFPPGLFNDTQGNCTVSHSTETSITLCVFQMGN